VSVATNSGFESAWASRKLVVAKETSTLNRFVPIKHTITKEVMSPVSALTRRAARRSSATRIRCRVRLKR